MARLIDADKAKFFIADVLDSFGVPVGDRMANRFIDVIDKLPTVDAVEVVHGQWEFSHTTTVEKFAVVKCSNCGHEAFAIANYVKEGHYCPHCGAKMDGGKGND